ncbi:replicative DNA helicase [Devosia pacifica]|uniref:DNA 5'-3' helicase n=1 Tax=Devosia pacifica TaxID=1335967 RepID=A0A918RY39_9HYPH|nr:DnaB-like helicase C-terminal domain-containing protein [Devosia pacifica]GHA15276.1 replicative DNA helicase [Devosia pacifica]
MNINLDAEQALIGAVLMNPDALDVVDGLVRAEDFSEPVHVQVYDAFLRARDEGRRVDVTLMQSVLGLDAKTVLVKGMTTGEYIAKLAANATTVLNAPDYARVIAEAANYRRLEQSGRMLSDRASQGYSGGTPGEVASSIITDLDAIVMATANKGSRRVSVGDAVASAHSVLLDRMEHGVETGIGWGVSDLDDVTKLYPGELTIAAARPSMGKTTLALSSCLAAARSGAGVLFVSLEMGEVSLGQRVLSDIAYEPDQTPIAYTDIRDAKVSQADMQRLSVALERVRQYPLIIEQEPGLTVSQIAARARAARKPLMRDFNATLDLLVVDHLGLIASGDRYAGARHLELGAITSALKVLAKDMQIPVLLLCQLSRGVESRENKRPQLSDLRESGRIEEDADTVVLLYREAYYLERTKETEPDKDMIRMERLRDCRNVLEINVAKQRQGATRTVEAFVHMPSNAIRNLARRY